MLRSSSAAAPRAFALLALAGHLAACSSVDDAVSRHGPGAEVILTRIEGVRDAMAKRPLLTNETIDTRGAKLVVDVGNLPSEAANTAVVYVEDLAELGEMGAVYARTKGSIAVPQCASYARHRTEPWDPLEPNRWNEGVTGWEVADRLERCGKLTHLIVVRTIELALPGTPMLVGSMVPTGPTADVSAAACGAPNARCTFAGGRVKAEVHLYSLEPLEHRGGFVFEAESSERLRHPGSGDTLGKLLENDLAGASQRALAAAVTAQILDARLVER